MSTRTFCRGAGESGKNLYPIYKSVYKEAKNLAKTKEELRMLSILRYRLKVAKDIAKYPLGAGKMNMMMY